MAEFGINRCKKNIVTINLKKGENIISIIGKGPEIPNIEFIKLSSSLSRSGISDSKYMEFVESVNSNTLNEVYNIDAEQIISNRGNNGEIYTHYLDIPALYTKNEDFYFVSGQTVTI